MKQIVNLLVIFIFMCISIFFFSIYPKESFASLIEIKNSTDGPETAGDYTVSGVTFPPGGTFQVLELKKDNYQSNTHEMKGLWNTLNDSGIVSTTTLGFGFDLNETGQPGTNYVKIQELVMTFELPDKLSNKSFNLGDDLVHVYNYTQGQETFEAMFQVNLGFDFMNIYNADSVEKFTISSTIDNVSDGPEIYMLSSSFTAVPIPSTVWILGTGLVGLVGIRRKLNHS